VSANGWDREQYERFAVERRLPFVDLLAMCHEVPGGQIVDLGCGSGALTAELHEKLHAGHTLGLDASASMLGEHDERADLEFVLGDLGTWQGNDIDLVFANASLHWVPDHPALLARLRASLAPGGQLAFQVPSNFAHPSHVVAESLLSVSPFAEAIGPEGITAPGRDVLAVDEYARLLVALGARKQRTRLEIYAHPLASSAEVVEWTKGTYLTPIREALPEALFEEFVERYRERLVVELGDARPYVYLFPRILCWAEFP
jgi:trans-aconitate 2-methyltransferase